MKGKLYLIPTPLGENFSNDNFGREYLDAISSLKFFIVEELKKVKGKVFVATAGFVPCSIFCKESHNKGLASFLNKKIVHRLNLLEKELSITLPHLHPEYQGHYYDFVETGDR